MCVNTFDTAHTENHAAFSTCRPETSQSELLQLCGGQQLLDAALAGYNVTIFAYGAWPCVYVYVLLCVYVTYIMCVFVCAAIHLRNKL
jgi:hypothetical protein